jgi:hypothetical protein
MAEEAERVGPKFRRVVTGHDADGNATIRIDGHATNHKGDYNLDKAGTDG